MVTIEIKASLAGPAVFRVKQMKWGKIPGKAGNAGNAGNAAKDKTVLIYKDYITLRNIPLEAQLYVTWSIANQRLTGWLKEPV